MGDRFFDNNLEFTHKLSPMVQIPNDNDNLVYLSLETIINGHSVLIFCPTKNWCEKLAETISKEFFNLGKPTNQPDKNPNSGQVRSAIQNQLKGNRLKEVLEQLKRCPAGLDPALSRSISFGVAYHHAGLTFDERDIVEGAFKEG